ncbi:hypothetical protein TRIUR3_15690 [Triticum urartu]|uniref:Uncharacterized protein n=1 Tax=Triticum urartu TaxID=4572 RepID=M7ZJV1_TRIUA|nr:hypothetical protein TRIUR3_15690 [Triticum urartu]
MATVVCVPTPPTAACRAARLSLAPPPDQAHLRLTPTATTNGARPRSLHAMPTTLSLLLLPAS